MLLRALGRLVLLRALGGARPVPGRTALYYTAVSGVAGYATCCASLGCHARAKHAIGAHMQQQGSVTWRAGGKCRKLTAVNLHAPMQVVLSYGAESDRKLGCPGEVRLSCSHPTRRGQLRKGRGWAACCAPACGPAAC